MQTHYIKLEKPARRRSRKRKGGKVDLNSVRHSENQWLGKMKHYGTPGWAY
jgi:hypothetical protein